MDPTSERRRIDWDEVRARLHESQLALDRAIDADPQRVEEVHRQRAAHLASRQNQSAAPAAALRVLVFSVGLERYALDFADLKEILPFVACTPIPGGFPELLGVVNVAGEIRSVLDLGRMLGCPGEDGASGGYLLLVRLHGRETALRVDALEKTQLLAPDELASLDDAESSPSSRYVAGLGPDRVRVLSSEALLGHPVFRSSTDGVENSP
jgi:purine-binding chemotaxis protein CheW